MAIEVEKSNLSINQIVADKNENVMIEGDCIVPDVKPDILEIIGTSGIINVYKREVSDGKVRIDGCIQAYIMYMANDENGRSVRSINHTLDFSQVISVENVTSEMNDLGEVTLQSLNCKIINERKISLKASVNFGVKIFTNSNVEFVNNVNLNDIQKLENTLSVNSVLGIGRTKTNINENVTIDNTNNLAEILRVTTKTMNMDTKISYNKILTKADLNLKIMYLSEDGRINVTNSTFPVMGFIDMQDVAEDNICVPSIEIKNMLLRPNGSQDHSISVDIEMEISAIVYQNREINVIQDLYSPSTNLDFIQKNVQTIQNKSIFRGTHTINQRELLDIGDEKVYDIDINVIQTDTRVMDGTIEISGNVEFVFIHSTNSMTGIGSKKLDIPFSYRMQTQSVNMNTSLQLSYDITNENFNIMPGGEVDLKVDIEFIANTTNIVNLNLIENVTENQNQGNENFNMVIYFTKQNDDLWKIAKTFRSTKQTIMQTNNLQDEKIAPGTQLFITKCTN